jgi:putative nucleotidyltransferase with HDIG domain
MNKDPKSDMVAVPVEHFFSGLKTDVDVFIQLADHKFVMITRAGESFDLEQLKRYQIKNLSHLYINKDAYGTFMKKQISIAGIVLNNDQFGLGKKTQVVTKVAESIYQAIQTMGFDQVAFDAAKEISDQVINLVESHAPLAKLLEGLQKSSEETLRHSVAVSFVAPMIGQKLSWGRKETLEKLSLGGILHDIGEKELSPEAKGKPRAEWSFEEVKEYESHPYRGMMILSSLKNLPEDIIAIVYEHHENSMGQGFPRRLWDMKIHPLARVVAVANTFCELTLASALNPNPLSPAEAVAHMEKVMGQPFSKESFNALKKLVGESGVVKVA